MKTVGIIGGLGPETTSEFYLELVFSCHQKDPSARPPIMIYSVPMPYELEKNAIVLGLGEEKAIPLLVDAAQKLEQAGADFLVMPCNSFHAFIQNIREAVNIPVLSIVEETTKFLQEKQIISVGLLSTVITQRHKLYENAFEAVGIKAILPSDFDQAKIGKIIHNLVINRQGNKEREELIDIVNEFEKAGVKHVVLACTDLQLLIPEHPKLKIHDTMKILADATVREIVGNWADNQP